MSPENTEKLYANFPQLYRSRTKTIQESTMPFGFQCEDGWFDVIWNLSVAIEEIAAKAGLDPNSDDWPDTAYVKQERGAFFFKLENNTLPEIDTLIDEASTLGSSTCEECGAYGYPIMNESHWIKTLCYEHAETYVDKNRKKQSTLYNLYETFAKFRF